MAQRYVCEISPPHLRGPLTTTVQLLITIGLCIGFFFSYGTSSIPSSLSWRLPFALHAGIALVLAIAAHIYLPHSPRWLAHKGRKEEASRLWDQLGVSNTEREKDLLQNPALNDAVPLTQETVLASAGIDGPLVRKQSFKERMHLAVNHLRATFGKDAKKPMILGIFLMAMQQLSGIDGVVYVSNAILFSCCSCFARKLSSLLPCLPKLCS